MEKLYYRYGSYNGEKIENYFWKKMIEHPDKTPKQVREDLNLYYNNEGNHQPIYTMKRKGYSVTKYKKLKIVIGGYHKKFKDPDHCLYNDVIILDDKKNISIYGYPIKEFSPLFNHSATIYDHYIYIIGGICPIVLKERTMFKMKIYQLNLNNFKINEMKTNNEKILTLYNHKAKLRKDKIYVSSGFNLCNIKNKMKYVYDIKKNEWIIKKEK